MNIFKLSNNETWILKGIAIIAMILHHVLGCIPSQVEIEPYIGILEILGNVGKVCVSIFLFCSGYGLSIQYSKVLESKENIIVTTLKFIFKRFVKFYIGYWPIFFLFVPLGVCIFDRPLEMSYGEKQNLLISMLCDILGVMGYRSYNITWWFNKLIILLYLLFPLIFILSKKNKYISLIISLILMFLSNKLNNYYNLLIWQFPFVFGIIYELFSKDLCSLKLSNIMYKYKNISILILLFVFILLSLQRVYDIIDLPFGLRNIKLDGFITIVLVLILSLCKFNDRINGIFILLGKHSMNIYMIHSFIYWYWFPTYIYIDEINYCGLNAILLLLLCLIISIMIEKLKNISNFNKITNKLTSLL